MAGYLGGAPSSSYRTTYVLTGSSTGFVSVDGRSGSGTVEGIIVRLDAVLSGASAAVIYVADGDDDIADAPADDDIVVATSSITLTASATVASLDTDLDQPRRFSSSRIGASVTATGAYKIYVTVWGGVE